MKRPWPISVPEHVTRTEPSGYKCTRQGLPVNREWNLQYQGKCHKESSGSCSDLLGFGEEPLTHFCASACDQDSAIRVQVDQAGAGPSSPCQHRLEPAPHMVSHQGATLVKVWLQWTLNNGGLTCKAGRQGSQSRTTGCRVGCEAVSVWMKAVIGWAGSCVH